MNTYIITYHLKGANTDLNAKIRPLFLFFCPIHSTAVAVRTEKSAKDIRELLRPLFPQDAMIFVIRSGTEAAWVNSYGEENNTWLKKYL